MHAAHALVCCLLAVTMAIPNQSVKPPGGHWHILASWLVEQNICLSVVVAPIQGFDGKVNHWPATLNISINQSPAEQASDYFQHIFNEMMQHTNNWIISWGKNTLLKKIPSENNNNNQQEPRIQLEWLILISKTWLCFFHSNLPSIQGSHSCQALVGRSSP